jgi:hypothetical protein
MEKEMVYVMSDQKNMLIQNNYSMSSGWQLSFCKPHFKTSDHMEIPWPLKYF